MSDDLAEHQELPRIVDYLQGTAAGGEGFLVGERLTLAHISVASPFANLVHAQVELAEDRHQRTLAYTRPVLEPPSFKCWIERESGALAKAKAAA